jgi:methylated-DNA-protein-cysteine methyltransferase-like protein
MNSTYRAIYKVIKRIPRGGVATYGQVAQLAGFANHARLVGYALHALRETIDPKVPWHRVINARGKISLRDEEGIAVQRGLLEREGIEFDERGRIDLGKYGMRGRGRK